MEVVDFAPKYTVIYWMGRPAADLHDGFIGLLLLGRVLQRCACARCNESLSVRPRDLSDSTTTGLPQGPSGSVSLRSQPPATK